MRQTAWTAKPRRKRLCKHLRLSLEPGQAIRIAGERLGQNLQRHLAVELGPSPGRPVPCPLADEGGDVEVAESGTDF